MLRTAKTVGDVNKLLYPFIPHFQSFPNIDLNWFTFISPAWHFSLGAPDPTHILPILAALATYMQLRMSQPKTSAGATTDAMAQQMKIMQLVSPLMVGFFGWNYAAGLALYWTISSLFAMVQQYFVTGWGALLVTPDLGLGGANTNKASSSGRRTGVINHAPTSDRADNESGKSGKSYTGDQAKETKIWIGMMVTAAPRLRDPARGLWQEAKELHLIFCSILKK